MEHINITLDSKVAVEFLTKMDKPENTFQLVGSVSGHLKGCFCTEVWINGCDTSHTVLLRSDGTWIMGTALAVPEAD